MNDGKMGRDELCAWMHRPPSNSEVCFTARVKREKKKLQKEKTNYVYEKKGKAEVMPPPQW